MQDALAACHHNEVAFNEFRMARLAEMEAAAEARAHAAAAARSVG
jgi:hypothetical protein